MKLYNWKPMVAAAVMAATLPAAAQNASGDRTFEGSPSNAARGAAGEAGTVGPAAGRPGTNATNNPGQNQPGAIVRDGVNEVGGAVREGARETRGVIRQGADDVREITPGERTRRVDENGRVIRESQDSNDRTTMRNQQGQQQLNDAALVSWISADNEAEIALSELGQRQAQNQQVKQFSQKLIQEHTKFGEQLQSAARRDSQNPNASYDRNSDREGQVRDQYNPRERAREADEAREDARTNEADDDLSDRVRDRDGVNNDDGNRERNVRENPARNADGRNNQQARNNQAGMQNRSNNPGVALHQQIKQQCTQSVSQELRSKQGYEFDASYVGYQIAAHMAMIDTLKVAQQHASPELKSVLQKGEQATRDHLQAAKQLMSQLENEQRSNR